MQCAANLWRPWILRSFANTRCRELGEQLLLTAKKGNNNIDTDDTADAAANEKLCASATTLSYMYIRYTPNPPKAYRRPFVRPRPVLRNLPVRRRRR